VKGSFEVEALENSEFAVLLHLSLDLIPSVPPFSALPDAALSKLH